MHVCIYANIWIYIYICIYTCTFQEGPLRPDSRAQGGPQGPCAQEPKGPTRSRPRRAQGYPQGPGPQGPRGGPQGVQPLEII